MPHHTFVALQNYTRLYKFGVSELSLRINGQQEPSEDNLLFFEQNHVARAYHRLMRLMGRDQNLDTGLQISQLDFTTYYPRNVDYSFTLVLIM